MSCKSKPASRLSRRSPESTSSPKTEQLRSRRSTSWSYSCKTPSSSSRNHTGSTSRW